MRRVQEKRQESGGRGETAEGRSRRGGAKSAREVERRQNRQSKSGERDAVKVQHTTDTRVKSGMA